MRGSRDLFRRSTSGSRENINTRNNPQGVATAAQGNLNAPIEGAANSVQVQNDPDDLNNNVIPEPEQATQIAERFEASIKGRDLSSYSLQPIQQHLGMGNKTTSEAAAAADDMLASTNEELDYHQYDEGYDGQLSAALVEADAESFQEAIQGSGVVVVVNRKSSKGVM